MIRTSFYLVLAVVIVVFCFGCATAGAATVQFFDPSQVATPVSSGVTSDTISSSGYLFTYTRDKLFTGGTGHIIGRQERVHWPDGVEAQAVTTPPPGVTDYKARLTLQRVDGDVFDLTAFTFKLLANTGGAGGSLEIMPMLNGEDGLGDPVTFDATGSAGFSFSYDESPNLWGSTVLLKDFDTYKIGLYVDYAFTALTLVGAPVPLVGDYNNDSTVDALDYTVWRNNLGAATETPINNLGDGLHGVDAADFDVWKLHYGESGSPGAGGATTVSFGNAIPEPTSVVLLIASAMAIGRRQFATGAVA